MKNSISTLAQKNITSVRLFVLFVLLVLSSVGVFGQTKTVTFSTSTSTEVLVSTDASIVVSTENNVASTSTDFALWFMGNKQATPSTDGKASSTISKKQFVTSGISPNKVLIRTFLKRLVNQSSNVA